MNTEFILALCAALGIWMVVGRSIWHWGPGMRKHTVQCPQNELPLRVVVDQREGDFGSLVMANVTQCSLFGSRPPNCGKECLSRL